MGPIGLQVDLTNQKPVGICRGAAIFSTFWPLHAVKKLCKDSGPGPPFLGLASWLHLGFFKAFGWLVGIEEQITNCVLHIATSRGQAGMEEAWVAVQGLGWPAAKLRGVLKEEAVLQGSDFRGYSHFAIAAPCFLAYR